MLEIFFVVSLLSFFLILIRVFLPNKNYYEKKNFSYECGFDPLNKVKVTYSFKFFMTGVIFLIFDLEIILLIPLIQCKNLFNYKNFFLSLFFILFIIISLICEIIKKSLK